MPINSYTNSQKGYAALIGLLIAILILAMLAYGGSFFSKKAQKSQLETYVEIEKQAEVDLGGISDVTKQKQLEMER